MGILFTRLLNGASFEFAVARNRITGAANNPAKNPHHLPQIPENVDNINSMNITLGDVQ